MQVTSAGTKQPLILH